MKWAIRDGIRPGRNEGLREGKMSEQRQVLKCCSYPRKDWCT